MLRSIVKYCVEELIDGITKLSTAERAEFFKQLKENFCAECHNYSPNTKPKSNCPNDFNRCEVCESFVGRYG